MGLPQWSTTAANNANAATGVNWAEGQLPSTVNNSARQMMADVANWYAGPEWLAQVDVPTYVSSTSFTVPTNRTAAYSVGRRVQAVGTGYTINGTISTSVYTTLTTVTVVWDSGSLDNTVSQVALGILQNQLTALVALLGNSIKSVTATVASSALTLTLNPANLTFRSTTLANGVPSLVSLNAAISLVVPSAATLGTIASVSARLMILAINNAGTAELAVVNLSGGLNLDETTLISTTAISGTANAANVIYSATARTNVPFRVVGFVDISEATPGTWATGPTTVQGAGGLAIAALQSLGVGQNWQAVTGSRAFGTNYYNTTGRPIFVFVQGQVSGAAQYINGTIGGVSAVNSQTADTSGRQVIVFAVVPPGKSYNFTGQVGSVTLTQWTELR